MVGRVTGLALFVFVSGCAEGVVDDAPQSSAKDAPPATLAGSTSEGVFSDGTELASKCPGISIDRGGVVARVEAFSALHGVETSVAFDGCPPDAHVTCGPVTTSRELTAIVTFLDQADAALEIYPPDFFRTIHLDGIVFGNQLATNDAEPHALGGAVVPRGDHRSVLFLSTRQARFCNAALNARTLHHEIAHALDIGLSAVSETSWWPTLNPAGFAYGDVDLDASDLLDIDHPGAALITRYAGASVREDHAEIYTAMFMTGDPDRLRGWLREDRWLAAKFRAALRPLDVKWPAFVRAMPSYDALP